MANLHVLRSVYDIVTNLPNEDEYKISQCILILESGSTEGLVIKTLRNEIKEIIVKRYRLIFFKKNDTTYLVDIFKKQSRKTPTRIINRAEKIYKTI